MPTYKFGIAPTWQTLAAQRHTSARDAIAFNAPSKATAKHDKRAIVAKRMDGMRPFRLPDEFTRAAGRVNRFGAQSNTNEYIR